MGESVSLTPLKSADSPGSFTKDLGMLKGTAGCLCRAGRESKAQFPTRLHRCWYVLHQTTSTQACKEDGGHADHPESPSVSIQLKWPGDPKSTDMFHGAYLQVFTKVA